MKANRKQEGPPELSPAELLLEDVGVLNSPYRDFFLTAANTILEVKQYFNDERFDKVVAVITMNSPDESAARDAIRMYGRYNNRLEEKQRK